MEGQFDIIVIGSGLGGLECGAMLAREGMGVCVTEQADVPGGCLQSFSRRGHAIDTGMHYIGSMQAGGIMRRYFEYFGILGSLRLRPLDEAFDVVSLPGAGDYAYMHGYEAFEKHIGELFPHEKAGLGRYCAKLREIGGSIGIGVHRTGRLSAGGTKYLGAPAAGFIGECVADPLLRNVLAGTNPLYGGVRESSTLYHHAMINHSNIEGACRFTGGTQQIADALAAKIREHGGTTLVRSRVVALHTEGRRVTGVELADGRMLRAKTVISAIHPAETLRLIGPTPVVRKAFRERIGSLPDAYGLFSVYLLLKPGQFPYINRNLYYFAGKDVWKTLFDPEAMRPGMVLLSAQAPAGDPAWCDVPSLEGVGRLRPGTPPRSLHGAEGRHDAGDGRFRLRPPSGTEGCHRPYVCRHAAHLPPLHRCTARRGIRAAERLPQHHGVAHPGPHEIRKPAAHGAEPHGSRRHRRHAVGRGDLLGNSGHGIPRKKNRKRMKRLFKYTLIALAAILVLPAAFLCGLYLTADMEQPAVTIDTAAYRVTNHGGYTTCHGSFLRRNPHGLWELYTAGPPEESGAAAGALTAGLMHYQEQVFVDQIREFVPSEGYLKFLGGMIRIFNRNLGRHVPEEYRREIYARSLYCSHDFDAIGTPYERQLNYHAAHDIGHAMSQYMLVGCSSFAAWGGASDDGKPVVGRNFDFYMGDDFARNKIVTFCRPQAGYPFASIGWAGMIGVLSGMNSEGLTVTINAAKGPVPLASATPISILAREILQHAATIAEALEIARRRDTFVSESLLVASARDGRAAIIEKTPRRTVLYEGDGEYLICTNHYQSEAFDDDGDNRENIAMTDSPHRFARLEELMAANAPLGVPAAAAMLRDQRGTGGKDIGVGNDCSVNQSIAHHSVIFKPATLQMWVSTSPWQGGAFVCYDLGAILRNPDPAAELYDSAQEIPSDTAYLARDYPRVVAYRQLGARIRRAMKAGRKADGELIETFAQTNPQNFHTWKLLGEYYLSQGDDGRAAQSFGKALEAGIPRRDELLAIERLKSECKP